MSTRDGTASYNGYGAWGNHQAFVTIAGSDTIQGHRVELLASISAGSSSGTNPVSGSATWQGAMIGTQYGRLSPGRHVVGDAQLDVDFARLDVDVSFTNIQERGTGRAIQDLSWQNLPMQDGTFRGTQIEGRFYGPQHEEAGDVFDRNNIVGAFGAARQ